VTHNHQPDLPSFAFAATVAPGDTSTSTVLTPEGPQIDVDPQAVDAQFDLVYATRGTLQLKLDLLVPRTARPVPVVLFVPGGGFLFSRKEAAPTLRTFVVQYRTVANGATYVDGVADVKSAVRYLRAHANRFSIDASRAALWGESAGGYLAAMAGVTGGEDLVGTEDNTEQSSDVQAVIDKFGASDLSKIATDFDEETRNSFGAPGSPVAAYVFGPGTTKGITDDPDLVARADPASHLHAGTPPFLLMHGDADRLISPSQTLLLHTALQAKGLDSTRYVLAGADHGDLAFLGGDAAAGLPWSTRTTMELITAFLDRTLKS
jgi:acetyl esterase/lipase